MNFVDKKELGKALESRENGLNYFLHDLTLFQEGAEAMGFNKNIFNCKYMAEHYGNQKMDIRIQNPCDFGFNPYRMKNKSFNMFVKDYFEYQEIYENPDKMKEYIHIQHLKKGQVFFGVNFEPADKMLNM